MTKIAYKTIQNHPNFPNGFIIDHFETTEDKIEGYTIVVKEVFADLLAHNVTLMREFEKSKVPPPPVQMPTNGVTTLRPNTQAEPVNTELMAQKRQEFEQQQQAAAENAALFQQFLAWKKSQEDSNS